MDSPPGEDAWVVDSRLAGAEYLATLGIPLRSGRDLDVDDELDGPSVAVVSRAFAERFWPGLDAVGRAVRVEDEEVRVVGVAEDARYLVQDETPDPLMYRSMSGRVLERPRIVLRAVDPSTLGPVVRSVVEGAIPGHEHVSLIPASAALGDALLPQRLGALMVGAMGLAALFLSGVGLYGLVQFTVTRSVHELGVRLALGGSRRDLLLVVLRKGFLLVVVGIGLGIALAVPTARALGPFLGDVSPVDPLTFTAVICVFTGVALTASWLPARLVAGVDPTEALRGE